MRATRLLLDCGADIHEINAIRKHLSRIKGGHLAEALAPATVITLIVSDVLGDNLDVIGSGPTAPDQATFADCLEIIGRFALRDRMPASVLEVLERGAAGLLPETAKTGRSFFTKVRHHIVASNSMALDGAAAAARELGYAPHVLTGNLSGDVQNAAVMLARAARNHRAPACLLAGARPRSPCAAGEKADAIRNWPCVWLWNWKKIRLRRPSPCSAWARTEATAPMDAAGGILGPETLARARAAGLHPEPYLDNNDAYTFLRQAGALLVTGPTRTNVMDVAALLLDPIRL